MNLFNNITVILISATAFATLTACTNAVPTSQIAGDLGLAAPAPVQKNYLVTSSSASLNVSGTCDKFTIDLEMSLDNATTWAKVNATPAIDCQTGNFAFTISDISQPASSGGLNFGSGGSTLTKFWLRSTGPVGPSGFVALSVMTQGSYLAPLAKLTSGASVMTSNTGQNHKIVARVTASSENAMTGSAYTIKTQK